MGPLGITLVVDRLSALMLVVSSIVLLAVVFYAIGQGIRDGDERQPVSIFLPTYLVLSAGVCNAFLAGDLFNLFVGFEVLLSASFVLLTIGASEERVRAGISYVMVSMVSSLIFLVGIALVYAATGTLNMAQLAVRLDGVSAGTRSALFAVLLVAFGIKAAVFPLSTWLPDSYPTAPAPVTAVFAGLLTKVGVYAIIRAHTLLFPDGGLDDVLLVAALLTMLVGILGAIAQSDIKRLLSFTLVSHIGYMVFGVALSSRLGTVRRHLLRGAPHHRADHAVPGGRPDRTPGRRVDAAPARRAGRGQPDARRSCSWCPRSISVVFRRSRVSSARWRCWRPAVRTVRCWPGSWSPGRCITSLLTLYVVTRVWTKAFWRARVDAPEGELAAAAPLALLDAPRTDARRLRRPRRRRTHAGRDAGADHGADRCRAGADRRGRDRSSPTPTAPPSRSSTAVSTSPPCWEVIHGEAEHRPGQGHHATTAHPAHLGAGLADAGLDPVVGQYLSGQHRQRSRGRAERSPCCCHCRRYRSRDACTCCHSRDWWRR